MILLIHAISSFFKRGLLRISTEDVSSFCIDSQNTVLFKGKKVHFGVKYLVFP